MKVQNEGYEVHPVAAGGINPANAGSSWSNGAWSQVVASIAQDQYIVGLTWTPEDNDGGAFEWELDIGVGGSGAEVVRSTISGAISKTGQDHSVGSRAGGGETIFLPSPLLVASGSRIAVRCRSSSTTREPASVKLIYVRQANLVPL